tara:strand:+ start:314 stop:907 length:594 start_codon:yes stop_codon:yes gene_type:complete
VNLKNIVKKFYLIILILLAGCTERFSPKPNGYLRIQLAEKEPQLLQLHSCPFEVYIPNYFRIDTLPNKRGWINLTYPRHNCTIHLTYKNVNNNLFELLEESREMVYKHTIKADAIYEKQYVNNNHNTYGTLYDIHGQTASSVQFHITDSVSNFIRGALYFEVNPNTDSLKPVLNWIRADILQIMETLQWRNESALIE